MTDPLPTAEQRLLWMLVASPDGAFEGDLKLSKAKPTREALKRAGLIAAEKRVKSSRSKRKAIHLCLTDAGWAWCNRNMSWTKPRGKSEQLLDALLRRLGALFERQGTAASLADFIIKSTLAARDAGLDARIRAACLELGGGREAVRIRLADLRRRLADVPDDALSAGLRDLSRGGELTLYPLDDPRQVTPDDEAAAVHSSTGVPQHILYYGGIAS
jgi:hypothetical protein